MRGRWLLLAPLAILGIAVFITAGGLVVRSLWNWLLPPMFGLHVITFWQALGILTLSRILFGGFGLAPRPRPQLSPADRERFRQRMRDRWGFGRPGGSESQA